MDGCGTCTGLCRVGDSGGEVRGIPGPLDIPKMTEFVKGSHQLRVVRFLDEDVILEKSVVKE